MMNNFTPRAQQVLALARKEADRFNHNYVGTEHLLLGLIKLGQGVAGHRESRHAIERPELFADNDRVLMATGFAKWGMTNGTAAALMLADRLLGRENPWASLFNPNRVNARSAVKFVEENAQVGLHFIALNANLSRQFEFVQHSWINDPKFNGLYEDIDPITGVRSDGASAFTVQAQPVRTRYDNLPSFVTVRGGAYFFLPSLRALNFLAARSGEEADHH